MVCYTEPRRYINYQLPLSLNKHRSRSESLFQSLSVCVCLSSPQKQQKELGYYASNNLKHNFILNVSSNGHDLWLPYNISFRIEHFQNHFEKLSISNFLYADGREYFHFWKSLAHYIKLFFSLFTSSRIESMDSCRIQNK